MATFRSGDNCSGSFLNVRFFKLFREKVLLSDWLWEDLLLMLWDESFADEAAGFRRFGLWAENMEKLLA